MAQNEVLLRSLVFVLTILVYGTRLWYKRRIKKVEASAPVGLIVAMCIWTASLLVYPWGFRWFEYPLPLPTWLRWIGTLLMAASLPLSVRVYRALGTNFSTKLQLLDNHALVMSGPYKRVRHPMYATFVLCAVGAFLASSNLVVSITTTVTIVLMLARIKKEEALLVQRFGDTYREYCRYTGALWPKRI